MTVPLLEMQAPSYCLLDFVIDVACYRQRVRVQFAKLQDGDSLIGVNFDSGWGAVLASSRYV